LPQLEITMKNILITVFLIVFIGLGCACQKKEAPSSTKESKKLVIVTTLFPLYDFARNVGGAKAEVSLLLPPGVEAHSFEPKPADAVKVSKAGLFVFTNAYMEPWAQSFASGLQLGPDKILDASKGIVLQKSGPEEEEDEPAVGPNSNGEHQAAHPHHEGGMDPHIWLDFANAQRMVDNIANGMCDKDSGNQQYYKANAAAYNEKLKRLDAKYKEELATCTKRGFLHGGHYAFGYLAKRYGLQYESVAAVNPDSEPSPAKILALIKQMKAMGLKYVYSEELLSPRVSEMIAKETGATILMLHGAHNISREDLAKGVSYISLMEKNLENLKIGLECRK
jgi:zinc transport system substrate-binding protein